MINLVEVKC